VTKWELPSKNVTPYFEGVSFQLDENTDIVVSVMRRP